MPIKRILEAKILSQMGKGKAIIIFGPRQVGKSTLLKMLLNNAKDVLWLDAEFADVPPLFEKPTATSLGHIIGKNTILVIDEAQKIGNIGQCIKILTDYLPHVQVLATGSSAFELKNKLNEPLTGRKWEHMLFPFSFGELADKNGWIEEKRELYHRLIFGYYPNVVLAKGEEKETLNMLADSYLYKDILMWGGLKKPDKLVDLLKALAWQVGQEVSFNELGNMIGLKSDTVESYIQLLEQTFVLFRLPAYSGNHRKELRKGRKIYFYDNGIRNALIGDYRAAAVRQDIGVLWENWVISEMVKKNAYEKGYGEFYFWRTQDQQETDLVIDRDGTLFAYEIKWNPKAKARLSKSFSNAYPNHKFNVIHPDNILEILIGKD